MKHQAQTESEDRFTGRREYVIGDSHGCLHPVTRRDFLGNQAHTAFYRCLDCQAVTVVTYEER